MSLPHTLLNRPTGSTDPKYKADADEVMANLEYISEAIAFCRLEVDVSLTSENKNCDTQNAEYGASATNQCNLTHILGESYGGIFLGRLAGNIAYGDRLGIMDPTGRFWMVILGHDNQISFGDGTGGSVGKCLWERIDTGAAYTGYNDTTWMNTLTIWHLSRSTAYSNISHKVLKSQLILSPVATEGLDAADIPLIDSGAYFATDTIEAALAEFGAHKGDSTDPHGSTLIQTNIVVTGSASFAALAMSGNFAIATDKFTVNATSGNTVIGGTLVVTGGVTFNNNVVISGIYGLTIGGTLVVSGNLTASTQVITPKVYQTGNITLDAYSASAQTHIYAKNSHGTYDAVFHVDKVLQFDRVSAFLDALQILPYGNSMRFNLESASYDTFLYIYNNGAGHKASVLSQLGYWWLGTYNATFNRTSEGVLELDIPYASGDATLYFKNSQSGYDLNLDIDGDLTVHGLITGNVDEVVNARGVYGNLNGRLNAILAQAGGSFSHLVTVAKSGGQYSTIQSAINSITDANLNNEYVILIYPGTYQEAITLKAYVYLVGLGSADSINVPLITYPGSTVISASEVGRSSIKNLSIITSGTNNAVYANVGAGREMIIDGCYMQGAVECASGEVFMRNSRIYSIGGLNANGGDIHALWSDVRWIKTAGSSLVVLFSCRAVATTPSGTEAIYLNSTGVSKFENSQIYSTSSNTHGVNINASAQHIFVNCSIKANGTGNSFYSAAAQTVIASGCVVNADKHANVTVTPGTVWQTTNTLNASI